jgi:putative ABC transport system permease protein
MNGLLNDIRFALRSLLQAPGFSLVSVLTLGLGLGMSVAVWSIIDSVLIEPLPYPDSDRLVEIRMTQPERGPAGYPMSALDYRDYAERNRSFEAMAATFRENFNLTEKSSPERVAGAWVSWRFFDVMGVALERGRGFRRDEDQPGSDLVAVISNSLWQRRFAARPDILGQTVSINGQPYVIVGVAAEGFDFPRDTELWLPIAIDYQAEDRAHGWVVPVGRLHPEVGIKQARSDLEAIAEWIDREHLDSRSGRSVMLIPLKETIVGDVSHSLVVLLAAVACVLLIASANATILLSVRTTARQREMAVRQALGARRSQLVRLVMVESAVLSLFGGAAGLGVAFWCTRFARRWLSEFVPRSGGAGIDLGVFGFAALLSVAIGLLIGVLPAIRSRERDIVRRLRQDERGSSGGTQAIGIGMVMAEIALSVVLLAGTVLLIRTFVNLVNVDPGFESDRVLTAEVALTSERYSEDSERIEFYRRAIEEIAAIPDVEAVGTIYPLPLFGRRITTRAYVEGSPPPEADATRPLVELRFVSPGYLEAVGLELVAGRFIEDSDTADSPEVVVVNESFVRQLAPRGDPVGLRTTGWDPTDPDAEWQTIVGVVGNVRHINLADDAGPEMYIPVAQAAFEWATFVVRARSGSAEALANPIREAIQGLDPELPVFSVQTLAAVVNRSLGSTRVLAALLVLFAAVALMLSAIGVFSVVSYSVGHRVREVAIRMAVGGSPSAVVGLFVRQGLVPVVFGLALGVATALACSRVIAGQLFEIASYDPTTYAGVVLLILAIAALAVWLPARRAARVEPMTVLRTE